MIFTSRGGQLSDTQFLELGPAVKAALATSASLRGMPALIWARGNDQLELQLGEAVGNVDKAVFGDVEAAAASQGLQLAPAASLSYTQVAGPGPGVPTVGSSGAEVFLPTSASANSLTSDAKLLGAAASQAGFSA